jgi:hypothetical protein
MYGTATISYPTGPGTGSGTYPGYTAVPWTTPPSTPTPSMTPLTMTPPQKNNDLEEKLERIAKALEAIVERFC